MMRLTTVKVIKVKIVPRIPSEEECRLHLAKKIGVPMRDIEWIICDALLELRKHNRRWYKVILWHYGLDRKRPRSAERLAKLLKVSKSRVHDMHKQAVGFLHQDYVVHRRVAA